MTGRTLNRRVVTILVSVCAAFVTGCGTPPQPGFAGPGCYDHRNLLVPTVHSPGECAESTWTWRTEPWLPAAPKKP